MGADIRTEEQDAVITGVYPLRGRPCDGPGPAGRGGAGGGALAAGGVTVIEDCRHIERGYEDICRTLRPWERISDGVTKANQSKEVR